MSVISINKNLFFVTVYFTVDGDRLHLAHFSDPQSRDAQATVPRAAELSLPDIEGHFKNGPIQFDLHDSSALPSALTIYPRQLGCEAAAYVPITQNGHMRGLILVGARTGQDLTEDVVNSFKRTIQLTTNVLEQNGAGIQQLDGRQSKEMNALNTLSANAATVNDLHAFYTAIHEQVRLVVGDYGMVIALYDQKTNSINIPYLWEEGKFSSIDTFPLGEGLTSILIRTREPLMLVEDTEKRSIAMGAKVAGRAAKSWLGVPMVARGEAIGAIERVFSLSAGKIRALEDTWEPADGAPVFTVNGRYRARGWTEWTQGFQFGSALLQFDATGDAAFLDLGRSRTMSRMAPHLTHTGVHDHGFNNVSTYGALWRLAREGRLDPESPEVRCAELALKVSGAVQALRWTRIPDGGFIHSFNGAHSLFVDTIRSLRAVALADRLQHRVLGEQDAPIDLMTRLVQHARATAQFNVYYGRGRDGFDVRGRVAHESLFNPANGSYRGPSSQQGYSPFTTWTRGLAWAMLGFAEQLEFLDSVPDPALEAVGGRSMVEPWMREAASATCDFYIETAAAADGIPYWDTGAPGLVALGDWRSRPADPFNDFEPVDSSAAAIAAQGLLRLGRYLDARRQDGSRYERAGLQILRVLFDDRGPYLSTDPRHQGLLLHSVYHRPNGWDYVPDGARTPRGESSQWGDYHAREVALYVLRRANDEPYLTFFGPR